MLLLYPDTKVLPPGSNESFTVEKYKHFLNKPYSKINFFVCLETQFLSFVENKNNALENNDNENKDKHQLALTNDEVWKEDESYLIKVEKDLTDIIDNAITTEDHNKAATYITENNTEGTAFLRWQL